MPAPYRADHVGSLLRPPQLLDAREEFAQQQLTHEQLREIEDRAILQALELQRSAGIDVVTDGEYRRASWAGDFFEAVDGYVDGPLPITFDWRMPEQIAQSPSAASAIADVRQVPMQRGRVVGERLRQKRRLTEHESSFLKQHAGGAYKVTQPAASYIVARGYSPEVTSKV